MSFYFIEIDQKLNWSLNSNLEEELGGVRFGIDAEGNYGYKKMGADTVIPFKSGFDLVISSIKTQNTGNGVYTGFDQTIATNKNYKYFSIESAVGDKVFELKITGTTDTDETREIWNTKTTTSLPNNVDISDMVSVHIYVNSGYQYTKFELKNVKFSI